MVRGMSTTTDPEGRKILIGRLRDMADWLEAHPGIPLSPYAAVHVSAFTDDPGEINNVQHAALDTHFTREVDDCHDTIAYSTREAPSGPWNVQYQLCVRMPQASDPPGDAEPERGGAATAEEAYRDWRDAGFP